VWYAKGMRHPPSPPKSEHNAITQESTGPQACAAFCVSLSDAYFHIPGVQVPPAGTLTERATSQLPSWVLTDRVGNPTHSPTSLDMQVPEERVAARRAADALPSQGRAQRVEVPRPGVDVVADAVAVERYIPPVGHHGGPATCWLLYQAPQSRLQH
jgi:hypothetical protein